MAVKLHNATTSTVIQLSGISANTYKVTNAESHTIQASFVENNGNITALTVDLDGSLDDVTFFTLASEVFSASQITAKAAMFHVVNKTVRYVRINVSAITDTGDGTSTVNVLYQDYDEALRA